jgi:S-adenosylmethionine decarboxylase
LNEVADAVGRHCIYELYEGNSVKLNDEAFIKEALTQAAQESGATLLSITSHKFKPQGVTALALLSESHISIHTWPELGYAAIDAFTCGAHTDPEKACNHLKKSFDSTEGSLRILKRLAAPATAKTLL